MSTALATIDVNQYAMIVNKDDIADLKEAIEENMGSGSLSLRNLTRIKTPAGGATVFQVPTAEGMKNTETLTGIILVQQPRRVYYEKPMSESNDEKNFPECFSNDAKIGVSRVPRFAGDTIGQHECAGCPLAEWGPQGEKPRCQQRRQLFLLREGDLLPIVLDLPAASLKNVDAYLSSLALNALTYYYAVTEVSLKSALRGNSKNTYSEYVFKQVGVVPRELRPEVKSYQAAIKAMVMQPTPDSVAAHAVSGADVMGDMEDIDL